MPNASASRFQFIGHALAGDGPFRPAVASYGETASLSGPSYLVRYPRESDAKYARRNEAAFYASPLAQACGRFVGYISTKPAVRKLPHKLYEGMAENIDGKGNSLEVFFQQFLTQAKARGSLCLLVDMDAIPPEAVPNQAAQIAGRVAPYWTIVLPEALTDYEVGDDGKFVFAEFGGTFRMPSGERKPCTWHFDRAGWRAAADNSPTSAVLAEGDHGLGECPLLIWTEGGDFPHFGPFAAIADLSKRLFNMDSELDEILRSQTFSLLTMQVADGSTDAQKLQAAQVAGQTIGASNLLVHGGSTPAFIAPPDGPARIYLDRIDKMRDQIHEIGLSVATINEQESGIAMQMRFQAINAELSRAAARTEDLERRAWDLSAKWLGMQTAPETEWSRDYNIADVTLELQILADMQAAAMPPEVVAEQQRRIVTVQFGNVEQERMDELLASVDERAQGIEVPDNVIPLPDRNAPVREAAMRALNG
jgi:hypothetical protein